jgi:hypothetical protein
MCNVLIRQKRLNPRELMRKVEAWLL